jgi:hypothetical protein
VKEDQEPSGGNLVPSASRALIGKSSGLVRRGLEDLKSSAEGNAYELDANQRKFSRSVDEETYQKAKPHIIAVARNFYQTGMSDVDAMCALMKYLRDVGEFSLNQIAAMRPYILRFMQEIEAGTVPSQEDNEESGPFQFHRAAGFNPDPEQVEIFRKLIRERNAAENLSRLAELVDEMMKMSDDR